MHKIISALAYLFIANILWAQNFCVPPKVRIHTTITATSVNNIQPHGIAAVSDGFWVTGTINTGSDMLDFLVAKFNDSGRMLLLKRVGSPGDETSYPVGIAPTVSGGCVISGRSDEPSVGAGLASIACFNKNGTLKWWRRTTSNGNYGRYDAFRNVMVRKDGTVFGCGSSHQWNYDSHLLLAALDSNGNELFRNSYKYGAQSHAGASAALGSGYVVGGHDGKSPILLTVKDKGVVDKCFGYNAPDYCTISSLAVSPAGKIYVVGNYQSGGNYEMWVACINSSNGNFIWQKKYTLGYCFGGKIEWENNRLIVSFIHNTGGWNWHNGFAEMDSSGNVQNVKLIRFKNNSFQNHISGSNSARLPGGGMAFTGTNFYDVPNLSLALVNPCDTFVCSMRSASFTAVSNTGVSLTTNKGTMFYDGKFATNLSPAVSDVKFKQTFNCVSCAGPVPTRFRDTTVCANSPALYRIRDYNSSVLWSDGDTSHIKSISKSGIYHLRLINICGTYRDTIEIKNFPVMVRVLPARISLCPGSAVAVNGSQPLGLSYGYSWNDGTSSPQRTINSPGMYILVTTDACGSRRDTLHAAVPAGPSFALRDTAICDTPFVFIQNTQNYAVKIKWFDGDTSHIKKFNKPGKFYLNYSDSCGPKQDSFEIILKSRAQRVLDRKIKGCRGNGFTLNGTQPGNGIYSYRWSDGTSGPVAVLRNSSKIVLTTSGYCGSRTDTADVTLSDCICEICIPSAFTPGKVDGRNDVFKPILDCKYNDCTLKESSLRIFNRWGEKLYDAPATQGWDGTYKGEIVPDGQYIYVIYLVFNNHISGGKIRAESGTVTVLSGR